jgi:hypothetical protein
MSGNRIRRLGAPLDVWISAMESVALTNQLCLRRMGLWSCHWHISMDLQVPEEGEFEAADVVLSIYGHIKHGLLWLIAIELPPRRLAVDAVDFACLMSTAERIGDNLAIRGLDL